MTLISRHRINATVSAKKLKVFGESVKLAREGGENKKNKINISLYISYIWRDREKNEKRARG